MRVPLLGRGYPTDIMVKNATLGVVWSGILIGWHGEPSALAKLAKHLATLAALVNRTMGRLVFTQGNE